MVLNVRSLSRIISLLTINTFLHAQIPKISSKSLEKFRWSCAFNFNMDYMPNLSKKYQNSASDL